MSGKQEVLQVYAGWRHALRNLKLPEKGFFFTSGVSLGFPPQDSHRRHFQLRRTFVNISAGEETFFFCFCLFVETFSSVYLFPRRLNLKHRSVCVCCVWGLQVHLDTHPVRSSRNHIIQQRRRSAGFRVVLVVIWAVWSRMDYMDSGLRYTPKTSVSNLLLCRSGGGSSWLKVVTPCLCFYLLPEWFCSLACLWDIWETVIGQEVEQNLKL